MESELLWGLFALQLGYVRSSDLIAALQEWSLDRSRSLRALVTERHALSADRVTRLDEAVRETLSRADGPLPESTVAFTPLLPSCRFLKLRPHRKGGLGEVFVAFDSELKRDVALKEIQSRWADMPEARERFVREAEVTGRLEHPGIAPVYGSGTHPDGRPYYAMRFIEGETLGEAVRRFHTAESPGRDAGERALAFRELLGRFLDVCNTVAYAHSRGVLHRDLKPANIMLGPFGETLVVDWGLAKLATGDPSGTGAVTAPTAGTEWGRRMGTREYMAPEQDEGRTDVVGVRTDVYLLGAVLFEILTNRPPHEGGRRGPKAPRAAEVNPSAPAALDLIAARAMAVEPDDRHADARALGAEVRAWLAEEPVAAFREPIAALGRLAKEQPDSSDYGEQLGRARVTLGLVLLGMARYADAAEAFEAAIQGFATAVEADRRQPRLVAELATARTHLSRALAALGRADEAGRAEAEAVEEFGRLQELDPRLFRAAHASLMLPALPPPGERPDVPQELRTIDVRPPEPDTVHGQVTDLSSEPVGMGRFSDIQEVARGSSGAIYRAFDNDLRRVVALKRAILYDNNESWGRGLFHREAEILGQLTHPNVLPIHGIGTAEDGVPFLIVRFMDGGTLAQRIDERPSGGGGDYLRRMLRYFVGACRGVGCAHRLGIVHRDPKPANILLGNGGDVVVADWGLSEAPPSLLSGRTASIRFHEGAVVGTPAYMSPEAARGHPVTVRSDVYSLGATLFNVLTGRPWIPRLVESDRGVNGLSILENLFNAIARGRAPHPRAVCPSVSAALDAITARAMTIDPAGRYANADELADDVEGYLTGGRIAAYPESFVARWWRAFMTPPCGTAGASAPASGTTGLDSLNQHGGHTQGPS